MAEAKIETALKWTASDKTSASAWDDLVYSLFYPSILGSVIFDYADPMRFSLENTDRLFLLSALLAFVIDYWHMKNNIRAHDGSTFGFRFIDICVTILFLVSYYTFSHALTKDQDTKLFTPGYDGLLLRGLILITVALGLVLIYDFCRFGRAIRTRLIISFITLSVVFVGAYIVHGRIALDDVPLWFRCSSSLMTGLYALYVAT